jgi:spore maturation protein CgeB
MRIMVIRPGPFFSVADVCRGWVSGLRDAGATVADLNYDDILDMFMACQVKTSADHEPDVYTEAFDDNQAVAIAQRIAKSHAYEFLPDVVFVVSGFFLDSQTLDLFRARGVKVVVLCTESPYEDDVQVRFADHADVVLLNDPTNLERFKARNPNCYYVPHSYDPAIHTPGPASPDLLCDFAFCGTGYPSRIEFFSQVNWQNFDVKFAGMWKHIPYRSPLERFVIHPLDRCFDNAEAVELYRSAKLSANIYRAEANDDTLVEGWSVGPREIELAAVGVPFLREPRGEGDELFPMYPTFNDPDEFSDLLGWWLVHEDVRTDAASKARAAIADHTFVNRARWLLNVLAD